MADETRVFHWADYLVFTGVLLVSVSIGIYYAFTGGRQRTTREFLVGDRQLRTIPVALSILVSFVSAILVLGTPAEMYTHGTLLTMRTIGYAFACVLSSLLFVPLFFPLKVTSTFEYLDRRYKSLLVRLLGTVMMLCGNLFYMGLVIYSPAISLEAVTRFPFILSAVLLGAVTVIYTAIGGMKAVVWTDVFQATVMLLGLLAIVIQGTIKVGGLGEVFDISNKGGKLKFFDFDPDPTKRLTTWSLTIGGMFSTLTIFGIGQSSVQRYCSVQTLKQAKASVYLNIPGIIVMNILASLAGLVIYAYYAQRDCNLLTAKKIKSPNQIVPYFIMDVLNYPGFPGLFLAVLFCGALSSMSSCLNSAAAVTWEDILKRYLGSIKEKYKTVVTKVLVVFYGLAAMGVAFGADHIGGHVLWASLSFTGATTGPTLGMFLLGAMFRVGNAKGAVSGFVCGTALNLWITFGAFINKQNRPNSNRNATSCLSDPSGLYLNSSSSILSSYTSSYSIINKDFNDSFSVSPPYTNTTDIPSVDSPGGLNSLYSISFLWYSFIGSMVTLVIGLLISWATGGSTEEVDEDLLIPVVERLCCCLPHRWRHRSWPSDAEYNAVNHSWKKDKETQDNTAAEENGETMKMMNGFLNAETVSAPTDIHSKV